MKRILIIDDDADIRRTVAETFRQAGFEVVTAGDGKQGMALFRSQAFELVITDLIMPRQDGFQTIKSIRRLQPDLRIIAISGGEPAVTAKYLKAVAQHTAVTRVLIKPFTMDQLLETANNLLSGGEHAD
jgi:DNA-binding response OmpR family regulator